MTRLDVWLAEHGLAESRQKAQALVMAGRVEVDGRRAAKPGSRVPEGAAVTVAGGRQHVGRGALKLAGALDAFAIDPGGRVTVDVGASTGGFTETLLARGAARVYAVDVGRGQLHESLRGDPRVVVRERTNARSLSEATVGEPCSLAVMDVAFISVRLILPALRAVLAPLADCIVLVKPQFELRRDQVGRGGLVKDETLHRAAVRDVAAAAQACGYAARDACPSPITGAEGNREFFLHLVAGAAPLASEGLEALAGKAVAS